MSDLILISDGEDHATPPPSSKRARKNPTPTILILDTEPAPPESTSTPLFVAKTPVSDDVTVVKCSLGSGAGVSSHRENKFPGKRVISLESDSEDSPPPKTSTNYESVLADFREPRRGLEFGSSDEDSGEATYKNSRITEKSFVPDDNTSWVHGASSRSSLPIDAIEVDSEEEKSIENMARQKQIRSSKTTSPSDKALPKKRMSTEEVKLRKEHDKLQKAALKAEEAERKKLEKEKQKWEKGKLALKSIVAEIDTKLVEGSIGGDLLKMFCEKGITYRLTSNPIERSIVWTMTIPENLAQLSKIPYVLLMYEAGEFCKLVASGKLLDIISRVQHQYPSYTLCFLTNKLMSYINKMEREVFKNPEKHSGWETPPIHEVLANLTTHFIGVNYRHCVDEAEVAEHVVGLTSSLASCQFRKKLTWLSVNADGVASVDPVHKQLIKKSPWLKALVAIPKVQPRYAVAVWKKYPSMKSLLKVYMDPNKSVHEKEFLLKDLKVEVLTGGETRLGEVCSKRIYRVLMCPRGSIKTDEVENGAASFTDPFSTRLS